MITAMTHTIALDLVLLAAFVLAFLALCAWARRDRFATHRRPDVFR
jgi:hypothetical protein